MPTNNPQLKIKRKPVVRRKAVEVSGHRYIVQNYMVRNPRHAVELFRKQYGIPAETVGKREVLGYCDCCGKPILEGDAYTSDGEGVMILTRLKNGKVILPHI